MEQSPAVDVVGIGLEDGTIIVHNLRVDKTIARFFQEEGVVTSLSFRTDSHPILATASNRGTIFLWDLEKKKLSYTLKGAHNGLVATTKWLYQEPVLLSAGSDNSVKVFSINQSFFLSIHLSILTI